LNRPAVNIDQFENVYFLGIGGIGMSALARYFNSENWNVAGYDKTPSPLTDELKSEGIPIHFDDRGPSIPDGFRDKTNTLVIYTPAIPINLGERLHFEHNEFTMLKRAEVLGILTRSNKSLCVAGTHGKTTTSSMLAHILNQSSQKCHAFLGGISTNFHSNFVTHKDAKYTVIEADEFDRSFLQLDPFASIVTTTDADHLDIYGNENDFIEGFRKYATLVDENGYLICQKDVALEHPNHISYAVDREADYSGSNLRYEDQKFLMDLQTPMAVWDNIELGIPGIHNAENAIACIALCDQLGMPEEEIRNGLKTFQGVKRRFEYQIKEDELVYIDDYAHHPTEIEALISSVRLLYPDKVVTGIFQPHLYSRTRDFFDGFAKELSKLDQVVLLPIYPAREEPISGVTSEALLAKINNPNKELMEPDEAVELCSKISNGVILTIGAGDIDRIVPKLKQRLA
jgi:UDP-N-acetylmuramate--alanine ligase